MSDHKSSNPTTRREALRRVGNGFGMMAFAGMLGKSLAHAAPLTGPAGESLGAAKLDYPQRVKRVIFLFMNGGCSTIDCFDPKPALEKYNGQPLPGGTGSPSAPAVTGPHPSQGTRPVHRGCRARSPAPRRSRTGP